MLYLIGNLENCPTSGAGLIKSLILTLLLLLGASGCGSIGAAEPARVVVQWTTATELNTAGYNLYRGSSPDGPFIKINAQLIPAKNDAMVGGKYEYQDTNLTPGKKYYYQLEDVELSGATARHGPIVIDAPSDLSALGWLGIAALGLALVAVGGLWLRQSKAKNEINEKP